jgi:hypothetical protein
MTLRSTPPGKGREPGIGNVAPASTAMVRTSEHNLREWWSVHSQERSVDTRNRSRYYDSVWDSGISLVGQPRPSAVGGQSAVGTQDDPFLLPPGLARLRAIWKVAVRRHQAAIAMRFPPWLAGCKLTYPARADITCRATNR